MDGHGNTQINPKITTKFMHVHMPIAPNVYNKATTSQLETTEPDNKPKGKRSWFKFFTSKCDILQRKLQLVYKKYTLPKLAWLDRSDDLPINDYFVELQLNDESKPIAIEEIFKKVNRKKPLRIHIEGQPGFGKTTLANKLVHDWGEGKKYIRHFKLILMLPLRELEEMSFEQAIIKLTNQCDLPENYNVIRTVNTNMKNTLFILDRLDESSEECREKINKVLYQQMYSEATVITLCRSGLFELSNKEYMELFGECDRQKKFYDKSIKILGIQNLKNKKKFLSKYNVQKEIVDDVFDRLQSQLALFDSPPLFLMLLTMIVKQGETMGPFTNISELYKKLFNFIIKHSKAKNGKIINSDFDLFQLQKNMNIIQKIIYDFGKLSLQKIIKNDFQFECDDLAKNVYQYGFLLNHLKTTPFDSTNYYEAFHRSILEFAAAFSMWIDYTSNESEFMTNLELGVKRFIHERGTSQIILFFANLLGDDVDELLKRIIPESTAVYIGEVNTIVSSQCDYGDVSGNIIVRVINLNRAIQLIEC